MISMVTGDGEDRVDFESLLLLILPQDITALGRQF